MISFHRRMACVAAVLACIVAGPARGQDSNESKAAGAAACIGIEEKKTFAYKTQMLYLRNTCEFDVQVAWCVESYHVAATNDPPTPEPKNYRNCKHPKAMNQGSWNPRGFWCEQTNLEAGEEEKTYADAEHSGGVHYAACPAEVDGVEMKVVGSSESDRAYGCVPE